LANLILRGILELPSFAIHVVEIHNIGPHEHVERIAQRKSSVVRREISILRENETLARRRPRRVARVRSLITRCTGRTWITRGRAIQRRIAELNASAEQQIVWTVEVVGDVVARVRALVARVVRTRDTVVAIDSRARLTIEQGITRFDAVAEQSVVASRIAGRAAARTARLVARIGRTSHAVITIDSRASLTVERRTTGFKTVARKPIVACSVVGRIAARTARLVARVGRARDAVVAVNSRARLTTARHTGLSTVARQPVVAVSVGQARDTRIRGLVATLARTRIAADLAVKHCVTRLCTIAEQPVVTIGVVRQVVARVRALVARVIRTRDTVVAIDSRARLAIEQGITRFDAVAEQSVVASRIAGRVAARTVRLVARIGRTSHAVITIDSRASLTIERRTTGLKTVARKTIVACSIAGRIAAGTARLVARVGCARNAVVAINSRTGLAVERRATGFSPITCDAVVAIGIVHNVVARVRSSVARVVRARHAVVAGRRST